jgi:hypothetical protein
MIVAVALAAWAWGPGVAMSAPAATPTAYGTVNIEVVDEDGDALPPGLKVYCGYDRMGVTDKNGRATLRLKAGRHRIGVLQPDWRAGWENVEVVAYKTQTVRIRLTPDGLATLFPRQIRFDQGPIFPPDLKSLSGAVYDDLGRTVKLNKLEIRFRNGEQGADISKMIEFLPDGKFRTRPGSDLGDLLGIDGTLRLSVYADILDGTSFYEDELEFVVGRHRVDGRIVAPPSQPDMNVGGLTFKAVLIANDTRFNQTISVRTASDGSFILPNVPTGLVSIKLDQFFSKKTFYRINDSFYVISSTKVLFRILSIADEDAGYKQIQILQQARNRRSSLDNSSKSAAQIQKHLGPVRSGPIVRSRRVPSKAARSGLDIQRTSAEVFIEGWSGDKKMRAKFSLPKGKRYLEVGYRVTQIDALCWGWGLDRCSGLGFRITLTSGGKTLFERNMEDIFLNNEILWDGIDEHEPPDDSWPLQPVGNQASTGYRTLLVDAQKSAENEDAEVVLEVEQIGYLSFGSVARPLQIYADVSVRQFVANVVALNNPTDGELEGPKEVLSIPIDGKKNFYQKELELELFDPADIDVSAIQKVKVYGITGSNYCLFYEGEVRKGSNARRFRFPVTFRDNGSKCRSYSIGSDIRFEILVNVNYKNQSFEFLAYSPSYYPLWDMTGVKTYGGDKYPGGEKWAAKQTVDFLNWNDMPYTLRIDDISGEHGRNIEHKSHKYGTDVDVIQFWDAVLPGRRALGKEAYYAIRDIARKAAANDADALAQLKAAVLAQRAGMKAFLAYPDAEHIFVGKGQNEGVLPEGWLKSLIIDGSFKPNGSAALVDIGTKEEGLKPKEKKEENRITYDEIHWHHNHLRLKKI